MYTGRIVRCATLAVALSLFAGTVFAQAQPGAKQEFQPEGGQAGKDVVWVPTAQALVDRMLEMAKLTPEAMPWATSAWSPAVMMLLR